MPYGYLLLYLLSLDSCLGRYDGQVYEALMDRARQNPTNRHKVDHNSKVKETMFVCLFLGSSGLVIDQAGCQVEAVEYNRVVF